MSEPSASQFEALLQQCILTLEANGTDSVEQLLAQHPDVAARLRFHLDQLSALGILQGPATSAAIPERLGEFRLLRQIGRGGMGIVYLAEQTALQRQVALKLVHPEHLLFGGARERFRREVLAVARLQHPGIVPILTCGEADGIPFYAMECVQGASLAEVLQELAGTAAAAMTGATLRFALQRAMAKKHDLTAIEDAVVFQDSWVNACCRLAYDAAMALQHAHERRVLHRDLKPSNLLLTATGRVRMIDFGLASAEGEQRITQSRQTLGSVPYMAPEQLGGGVRRCDERTDVYGLGVTLYELLTLTLPHGDGSGTTRDRILAGHVEPLARRNALVHADAEAICMKAIDLDPARRYGSAGELAEDLLAFLEQRTVRARRPSWLLRTRRWARRQPTRAAVAVVAFLALVPLPLLFAWQQNAAAARVEAALDEAEYRLDQAHAAIDLMLLRTADARLADVPRTVKLRRQLLQDAVDLHERLVASASRSNESQRAREHRARSQRRLGSLQVELGNLEPAMELLLSARSGFMALLSTSPRAAALRDELGTCCADLARCLGEANRLDEQETALRQALAVFDELAAQTDRPKSREHALDARLSLATCLRLQRRLDDTRALLAEINQQLGAVGVASHAPLPTEVLSKLWLKVATERGMLCTAEGDTLAAIAAFEQALGQLENGPVDGGSETHSLDARLQVLERLGHVCHQRRDWHRAAPYLEQACSLCEQLATLEPELPEWRNRLAELLGTRAANQRQLGSTEAALADHTRAIDLLQAIVAEAPAISRFHESLALAFAQRAGYRLGSGQPELALADFELAEQAFELCLRLDADSDATRANFVAVLANHTQALRAAGQARAARSLCQRTLGQARLQVGTQAEPMLIELLGQSGDLALLDGDALTAGPLFDEAWQRAEQFLLASPDDDQRMVTAARAALNRGTLCLAMDQHGEAVRIWQEALPIARRARANESGSSGRHMLGLLLLRLCDVHLRDAAANAQALPEARRWFQSALAETGIGPAQLRGFPGLRELFAHPELQDLVPAGPASK